MKIRLSPAAWAAVLAGIGAALITPGCGDEKPSTDAAAAKDTTSAASTTSTAKTTAIASAAGTKGGEKLLFETPGYDAAFKSVIKDPVKPAKPTPVPGKGLPSSPPPGAPTPAATSPTSDARIAALRKAGEALIAAKCHPTVTVKTNRGDIVLEIDPEGVPVTAANFIALASRHFYDGLTFHRVEPGFVIQGGDPEGNGQGGPGYSIPDESGPMLHETGVLAMAKSSAPNSAGSQWYITLAPAPSLDHNYTVFGKVVKGMDIVLSIAKGDIMQTVTVSGLPAGFQVPDTHATRTPPGVKP